MCYFCVPLFFDNFKCFCHLQKTEIIHLHIHTHKTTRRVESDGRQGTHMYIKSDIAKYLPESNTKATFTLISFIKATFLSVIITLNTSIYFTLKPH